MSADTKYAQTTGAIGAAQTQIGEDIPDGFIREVMSIEASSDDGSAQNLAVYLGDSSDNDRTTKAILRVPSGNTLALKGEGGKALWVFRPTRTAGVVTNNRIYLSHETSAINGTITYRDVREE